MQRQPFSYPVTTRIEQIDDYHGTLVSDPYRWLEDLDSPETQAWIAAQNQVTFKYLEALPAREHIKKRLTELWNYERYSTPWQKAGRYFFFKNTGLQNHGILYTSKALYGQPKELLDPNKFSSDGTVALAGVSVSDDGRLLAYGISTSGSDWVEWRVRDVESGVDLPDRLQWVKFSGVAWDHDCLGFYYSRYDAPQGDSMEDTNYYQKLFYHRIGTPQSQDRLIYDRPDQKEWGFDAAVSEDGQYLIISVWRGTESKNLIFYQHLSDGAIVELISEFQASYRYIGNVGTRFWFHTDHNAPKGRVLSVDLQDGQWQEVIPQTEQTLEYVSFVNNQLITNYLQDAHSVIKIFDQQGQYLQDVVLPGIGSVAGFNGRQEDKETFYSFTSFVNPSTIYHYDLTTGTSSLYRQPQVEFDPQAYETKQVFYPSKDGTQIPMFITAKKGLAGPSPTLLYGYGGFNVSLTPAFSVGNLVWLEMGGVYAVPNLRGGGEYGESWHQAGTKGNKQNVFDDFIAAAEWLIANGYTTSKQLAISGGSNGGLLVGACMTQRPELFAAALPAVGVMDMLRFHLFTIGWAWCSEYGSAENPEEFPFLYAYSPLHNLKPSTTYPATLITTADHDDRVVPSHSFKFAATLQAAHQGDNPVLIRVETKAGHGAGKPMQKVIEETADEWAFLAEVLGMQI